MWILFAVLSAIFASLMSLLMKGSMRSVDAMLATAIRTTIAFVLGWVFVFFNGSYQALSQITQKNWWLLILAGVVTFATWASFFIALKFGSVAKVLAIDRMSIVLTVLLAALFLQESLSWRALLGVAITVIGAVLVII